MKIHIPYKCKKVDLIEQQAGATKRKRRGKKEMFAFNDGLIDESLAFHVSTNTFNNPAFDQNLADLANQVDLAECQITRKGTSKSSSRIVERQSKESGVRDDRRETTAGQSFKSSFAENLAFSFRSKLFVIDLNFKRKLRSLKTFAVRYFPRILFQQSAAATSSRRKNSSDNRTGTSFTNRNKIYDSDEQFWKNIIVDPSSRKSLTKQKAKILNRLERALEQIRSQNRRDVDDYYQQQQQQQNIPENNRATFVRQFEQTSDGLRHIRPGILGHLLLHHSDSLTSSSFSRPSTSTPPSSSSSSSSLAAAAPAAASSVGQPIVIGSQNWVSSSNIAAAEFGWLNGKQASAICLRACMCAKECQPASQHNTIYI